MADKLNCTSGNYQCGGKCQPNLFKCHSDVGGEKNPQIDRFGGLIDKLSESLNASSQKKKINEEIDKLSQELNNKKSLKDTNPRIIEPNEESLKMLDEILANDEYFKMKSAKIQEEYGIEDIREAGALAIWTSEYYSYMNELLYNTDIDLENPPDEYKVFIAANYYANKALNNDKMPKYSQEKMEEEQSEYKRKDLTPLAKDGKLRRGIKNVPDGFVRKYVDNIGKETAEENFFATTAIAEKNFNFTKDADVIYEITPKKNSDGVMVDGAKNELFEGEVLYKPGTKFKVNGVKPEAKLNGPNYKREDYDRAVDFIYNNSDEGTNTKLIDAMKEKLPSLDKIDTVTLMSELVYNKDLSESDFKNLLLNKYPHISEEIISDLFSLKDNIDEWAERKADSIKNNYNPNYTYRILLEEV